MQTEIKLPYTGKRPTGAGFTVTLFHLDWHPHGDVGSIGIPLKRGINHAELIADIEAGKRLDRRKYFAT